MYFATSDTRQCFPSRFSSGSLFSLQDQENFQERIEDEKVSFSISFFRSRPTFLLPLLFPHNFAFSAFFPWATLYAISRVHRPTIYIQPFFQISRVLLMPRNCRRSSGFWRMKRHFRVFSRPIIVRSWESKTRKLWLKGKVGLWVKTSCFRHYLFVTRKRLESLNSENTILW